MERPQGLLHFLYVAFVCLELVETHGVGDVHDRYCILLQGDAEGQVLEAVRREAFVKATNIKDAAAAEEVGGKKMLVRAFVQVLRSMTVRPLHLVFAAQILLVRTGYYLRATAYHVSMRTEVVEQKIIAYNLHVAVQKEQPVILRLVCKEVSYLRPADVLFSTYIAAMVQLANAQVGDDADLSRLPSSATRISYSKPSTCSARSCSFSTSA